MQEIINVVVADDHPIILAGYQHLLESAADINVISFQNTTQGAINACINDKPDVLILDLGLPADDSDESQTHSLGGLDVIKELRLQESSTHVLIATMLDKSPVPQRAMRAGATGYLVKSEVADELLSAIRTVAKGDTYISPSIETELSSESDASELLAELSKRELDIFLLLAEGLPATEIGELTHLSPKTVHAHRANILRKLNLKNNSSIVRFALNSGLIQQ